MQTNKFKDLSISSALYSLLRTLFTLAYHMIN